MTTTTTTQLSTSQLSPSMGKFTTLNKHKKKFEVSPYIVLNTSSEIPSKGNDNNDNSLSSNNEYSIEISPSPLFINKRKTFPSLRSISKQSRLSQSPSPNVSLMTLNTAEDENDEMMNKSTDQSLLITNSNSELRSTLRSFSQVKTKENNRSHTPYQSKNNDNFLGEEDSSSYYIKNFDRERMRKLKLNHMNTMIIYGDSIKTFRRNVDEDQYNNDFLIEEKKLMNTTQPVSIQSISSQLININSEGNNDNSLNKKRSKVSIEANKKDKAPTEERSYQARAKTSMGSYRPSEITNKFLLDTGSMTENGDSEQSESEKENEEDDYNIDKIIEHIQKRPLSVPPNLKHRFKPNTSQSKPKKKKSLMNVLKVLKKSNTSTYLKNNTLPEDFSIGSTPSSSRNFPQLILPNMKLYNSNTPSSTSFAIDANKDAPSTFLTEVGSMREGSPIDTTRKYSVANSEDSSRSLLGIHSEDKEKRRTMENIRLYKEMKKIKNYKSRMQLQKTMRRAASQGLNLERNELLHFPREEIKLSGERVTQVKRGATLIQKLKTKPDMNKLFPRVELVKPNFRSPHSRRNSTLKISDIPSIHRNRSKSLIHGGMRRASNQSDVDMNQLESMIKSLDERLEDHENTISTKIDSLSADFQIENKSYNQFISSLGGDMTKNVWKDYNELVSYFTKMQNLDDGKKNREDTFEEKKFTNWNEELLKTRLSMHIELLDTLEEREVSRENVYKFEEDLSEISNKGTKEAISWVKYHTQWSKKQNGKKLDIRSNVWQVQNNNLLKKTEKFKECILFYGKLKTFVTSIGAPTKQDTWSLIDSVRSILIKNKIVSKEILFEVMEKAGNEIIRTREALKIIQFIRKELRIFTSEIFDFIKSKQWEVSHEMNEIKKKWIKEDALVMDFQNKIEQLNMYKKK